MSDGPRGSLAPSLKLPARQFFYARPPWGKMKGGKNLSKDYYIYCHNFDELHSF
jgi:hypothetical protein